MTDQVNSNEGFDTDTIFVGSKPFMNYVTGVVMQFTTKGSSEVTIKSRGKFITRAVDVSQVVVKRLSDVGVADIKIGSDDFTNKDGKQLRVSFIEITLRKK